MKILLADDSLTAQNMGKKILSDAGYEVIAVSNGAQAMKRIASDKPDLVVLDVYMPGYSGVELCEHIRNSRETAATPVILSVGKMEAFNPGEGSRVRADGLIVKPFEASELLGVVKKIVRKGSSASRKRAPQPESPPQPAAEQPPVANQPAAGPEFEIRPEPLDVPQEIASTPAIGIELIPEGTPTEAPPSAPGAQPAPEAVAESEAFPAESEPATSVPIWVAEEVAVEPEDYAVPLHQQMQESETSARVVPQTSEGVETKTSEAGMDTSCGLSAPLPAEPDHPRVPHALGEVEGPASSEAEGDRFCSGGGFPETSPSDETLAAPESHAGVPQTSKACLETEPADSLSPSQPAGVFQTNEACLGMDASADVSAPSPQSVAPTPTEAAVDPARVAGIVEQLIDRLKPDLIAAVIRELQKSSSH